MSWLNDCVVSRINRTPRPEPPILTPEKSKYSDYILKKQLSCDERLVLILALSVHLEKDILTTHFKEDELFLKGGLIRSQHQNQLLPTFETALYLLVGEEREKRLEKIPFFRANHLFYKQSVLEWEDLPMGESHFNRKLALTRQYRDLFIDNQVVKPHFGPEFPAELVETKLSWEDMILPEHTAAQLQELKDDLELLSPMVKQWKMGLHAVPGCRVLFYGESGTGKTLAAKLIGQFLEQDVYRVDLSLITS